MAKSIFFNHEFIDILDKYPAPPSTKTYMGISHRYIYNKGLEIGSSLDQVVFNGAEVELTNSGQRAFMTLNFLMKLQEGYHEQRFLIAMRSCYDKSASVAYASGAQVAICSNLQIDGSDVLVMRKHTPNAIQDLEIMLDQLKEKAIDRWWKTIRWGNSLKTVPISPIQGEMIIGAMLGLGIITHAVYLSAMNHWKNPPFEIFEKEYTLWGVYNALTWGVHKLPGNQKINVTSGITKSIDNIKNREFTLT